MKKKKTLIIILLVIVAIALLSSCQKEELQEYQEYTFLLNEYHNFYHLNDGYEFDVNDIEGMYQNSTYLTTDTICLKEKITYMYPSDTIDYINDHNKKYYVEYNKEDYDGVFVITVGCEQRIYNDNIIAEVIKECRLK